DCAAEAASAGPDPDRYGCAKRSRTRCCRQRGQRRLAQRSPGSFESGKPAAMTREPMTREQWRLPFGANVIGNNRTRFRVWAPAQQALTLTVEGHEPPP